MQKRKKWNLIKGKPNVKEIEKQLQNKTRSQIKVDAQCDLENGFSLS